MTFCDKCGNDSEFRTGIAILHSGEMKKIGVYGGTRMSFKTNMRKSHFVHICRDCRKTMTLQELYDMAERQEKENQELVNEWESAIAKSKKRRFWLW